jgi:hypothetical protein
MQKPYRFVLDRVAGYADEAGAFLRRRRHRARPFARVWRPGGVIEDYAAETERGRELFRAAASVLGDRPPA